MIGVVAILAAVAGLLAVLSIVPATSTFPLLQVAVLLLAICCFLIGKGTGG